MKRFNYSGEKHKIITPDGYRLLIYRIPGLQNKLSKSMEKPPVLLQHGLLSGSAQWILRDVESSIGKFGE